jgi:hypothetical protein
MDTTSFWNSRQSVVEKPSRRLGIWEILDYLQLLTIYLIEFEFFEAYHVGVVMSRFSVNTQLFARTWLS